MRIEINHSSFILHSSGSVFWEDKNILLISDVHLGKISHFRKHGLAIPENAVAENFKRLSEVVTVFNPEKIMFLGDLFHSKMNAEWKLFGDWVREIPSEIILIEGNHDIIARQNYIDLGIAFYPELVIEDFLFTHHPFETKEFFNFCGHIHPGIKLKDIGRQSLKLACFFHQENQLILPAFGEFTGKYFIRPNQQDKVYAIVMGEVIRVM